MTPAWCRPRMERSARLVEQTAIEVDQVIPDTSAREILLDQVSAGASELLPKLRICCETFDGVGQCLGVVERYQERIDARTGDVAASWYVGRNQRPSARRSLRTTP